MKKKCTFVLSDYQVICSNQSVFNPGSILAFLFDCLKAEKYERDKNKLSENISTINARLLDARVVICDLEDDLVSIRQFTSC